MNAPHNFRLFAIFVPKIITVGGNLSKFNYDKNNFV